MDVEREGSEQNMAYDTKGKYLVGILLRCAFQVSGQLGGLRTGIRTATNAPREAGLSLE